MGRSYREWFRGVVCLHVFFLPLLLIGLNSRADENSVSATKEKWANRLAALQAEHEAYLQNDTDQDNQAIYRKQIRADLVRQNGGDENAVAAMTTPRMMMIEDRIIKMTQPEDFKDPFFHRFIVRSGPHQYEAIQNVYRPMELLNEEQRAPYLPRIAKNFGLTPERFSEKGGDHIMVANIWHQGHHRLAIIPKNQIENYYYLKSELAPLMAHSELVVKFKKPVKLISQDPADSSEIRLLPWEPGPVELYSLVFSYEYASTEGEEYSIGKGIGGEFPAMYLGMTLWEKTYYEVDRSHRKDELYRLKLDEKTKVRWLVAYVQLSQVTSDKTFFTLLNHNCSKSLANFMDQETDHDILTQIAIDLDHFTGEIGFMLSPLHEGELQLRGILDRKVADLNDYQMQSKLGLRPTEPAWATSD